VDRNGEYIMTAKKIKRVSSLEDENITKMLAPKGKGKVKVPTGILSEKSLEQTLNETKKLAIPTVIPKKEFKEVLIDRYSAVCSWVEAKTAAIEILENQLEAVKIQLEREHLILKANQDEKTHLEEYSKLLDKKLEVKPLESTRDK
jgi:hypothetical protein